jgi:hypothetical protein
VGSASPASWLKVSAQAIDPSARLHVLAKLAEFDNHNRAAERQLAPMAA